VDGLGVQGRKRPRFGAVKIIRTLCEKDIDGVRTLCESLPVASERRNTNRTNKMKTITTTIQDREVILNVNGDSATLTSGDDFCNYTRSGGDFEPTTMSDFFSGVWTEESETEVWEQFVAKFGYSEDQ
jgi:hypothetical protein